MIDIIIIGAGTAGLTAAVYACRSGKTVTVFESENIGGQIANSPRVENFPSIKSISGSEFANNLMEQAMELGANIELEKVLRVTKGQFFTVTTEYGKYEAKTVIIATGVKHRQLGLPREEELLGHGISYCAVCDGPFFKGEEVALIGDANSALQYALLLANYCPKVYLYTLFDRFFGEDSLVKQVRERSNIEIRHNLSLKSFVGSDELEGLVFENTLTKELVNLNVKGVFIAIGQIPDNQLFSDLVELDHQGYIITNNDCETNVTGLFAAGDCRKKTIRQLTTAVSDGAIAAIKAVNYIDNLN